MRIKQIIQNWIFITGILSVPTIVYAQTDVPSSDVTDSPQHIEIALDESIKQALDSNPEMKALRKDVDRAYGEIIAANTFSNPAASYSTKEGEESDEKSNVEFELEKEFHFGTWGPKRKAAKAGYEGVKEKLRASEQKLIQEVKTSFYFLLSLEGKIELAQDVFQLNDELAQIARARLERGEVSEVEANILEVERDGSIQEKKSLEAAYYEELLAFKNLLGYSPEAEVKPRKEFYDRHSIRDLNDYLDFTRNNRPEILSAQHRITQTKAEAKLAEREAFPPVTLGFLYERETSGEDLMGGKVSIPIPVFDRNQARIYQTQAAGQQAEAEQEGIRFQVEREIRTTYKNLELLGERIDIYEQKMEPKLEKTLEIYKDGYKNGQVGLFEIFIFERQYFKAKSDYLGLVNEYVRTAAELERVIGGRFEDVKTTKGDAQ